MFPDSSNVHSLFQISRQMGLELSEIQIQQLLRHLDLLVKWNKIYNLTAIRVREDMLSLHLLDSLIAVPAIHKSVAHTPRKIVDVGSGAGFPGLVIAVAVPDAKIVCVDSVGKKVGFIRQVIAELGLSNASAVHSRIENLPALEADLITSRAFTSLRDFTALTSNHLAPSGVWMAMKGKTPEAEISNLAPRVEVFHVEQLSVPGLLSERCLVWMRVASEPTL